MSATRAESAASYYCQSCEHPRGYHVGARGCTMPLDLQGLPAMRTDQIVGPCGCGAQKTSETATESAA